MKRRDVVIVFLIFSFAIIGFGDINKQSLNQVKSEEYSSQVYARVNLSKFINFYDQIKPLDKFAFHYSSSERKKFKRFPGNRKGVKITDLTSNQRIQLHDLLNDLLSGQGYLKLIGIITHEDASARVDKELGREKYWITFFGKPGGNENWGFRFEGHHASLNFSFYGDKLISNTPFIVGCFPAIMKTGKWSPLTMEDEYREGYNILFEEEDIALKFIRQLDKELYRKGFVHLDTGTDLTCEDNSITDMSALLDIAKFANGITFSELGEIEKQQFAKLVNVYFTNFNIQRITKKQLTAANTKFIFTGNLEKNQEFYYRIVNEDFIIEFQNIGNHIHCLLRNFKEDFGQGK